VGKPDANDLAGRTALIFSLPLQVAVPLDYENCFPSVRPPVVKNLETTEGTEVHRGIRSPHTSFLVRHLFGNSILRTVLLKQPFI